MYIHIYINSFMNYLKYLVYMHVLCTYTSRMMWKLTSWKPIKIPTQNSWDLLLLLVSSILLFSSYFFASLFPGITVLKPSGVHWGLALPFCPLSTTSLNCLNYLQSSDTRNLQVCNCPDIPSKLHGMKQITCVSSLKQPKYSASLSFTSRAMVLASSIVKSCL